MAAKSRATGRRVRADHAENGRLSRGRRSWSGRGPLRLQRRGGPSDGAPARSHRFSESRDGADGDASSAQFWKEDGMAKGSGSGEISLMRMLRRLLREESRDRYSALANTIVGGCGSGEWDEEIRCGHVVLLGCALECAGGAGLKKPAVSAVHALALAMNKLGLMTGFVEKMMDFIDKSGSYSAKLSLLPIIKKVYDSCEESADCPGALLQSAGGLVLRLQSMLEQEQCGALMCVIVDLQLSASRLVPATLTPVFKDMVDILVGWHIEPGGSEDVRSFVAAAMLRLHVHWSRDPRFGVTLTSQFVEDISAYTQDIGDVDPQAVGEGDSQTNNPEDIIEKLLELIRVYSAVVKALSRAAVPVTGDTTFGPIVAALSALVESDLCLTVQPLADVTTAGCECLSLLLPLLSTRLSASDVQALLGFISFTAGNLSLLSDQCLLVVCGFYCTVLSRCGSFLQESVIDCLFESQCLLKLRKLNKQVDGAVLDVYRAGLSLKNVPLLLNLYAHVVSNLQSSVAAINKVYESSHDDVRPSDVTSHVDEAMFLLQTLTEFVNTNNSIIGLWALRPSLVALLSHVGDSDSGDVTVSVHSPAVHQLAPELQTAALIVLRSHCAKHRHFISTSALLVADSSRLTSTPSSGKNFLSVLQLLTHILAQDYCPSAGFCLAWAAELLELAAAACQQLSDTAPLEALLRAMIARGLHVLSTAGCEETAAKAVATCAASVSSLGRLQVSVVHWPSLCRLCALAINSISARVRSAALSLAARLHSEQLVAAVCTDTLAWSGGKHSRSVTAVRNNHGASSQQNVVPAKPSLRLTQFCHLLSDPNHWRSDHQWQLYHQVLHTGNHVTSDPANRQRAGSDLSSTAAPPTVAILNNKWCSSAAQCLASQKLRVAPFVKADKCLTALDVQLQTSCSTLPSYCCWPPALFLASLHRSVHVASFGSALAAADFSKAVSTFYQINRRTSIEWLNQAERHLLSALETKVFHIPPTMALSLLYSLIRYSKDATCFINLAIGVAISAGCADTVLGLSSLIPADKTDGVSLRTGGLINKMVDAASESTVCSSSWLDAAYLLADSRLSEGADTMRRFLLENSQFVGDERNKLLSSQLCNQVFKSYMEIGKYEDAATWSNEMNSLNVDTFDSLYIAEDSVRLLSLFSECDYSGAAELAERLACDVEDLSVISARSYIAGCLSSLKCNNRLPYSGDVLRRIRNSLSSQLLSNLGVNSADYLSPLLVSLQMVQQLSELESGQLLSLSAEIAVPVSAAAWSDGRTLLDSSSLVALSQWQAVLTQCHSSVSAESVFNWPLRLRAVRSLRDQREFLAAGRFLLSSLPLLSPGVSASSSSCVRGLSVDQLMGRLAALVCCQSADELGRQICHEAAKIIHSQGRELIAVESLLSPASAQCPLSLMLIVKYLSELPAHLVSQLNLEVLFDPARDTVLFGTMVENIGEVDLQIGRVLECAARLSDSESLISARSDSGSLTADTARADSGSLTSAGGECWRGWADWCFRRGSWSARAAGTCGGGGRSSDSPLFLAVRRHLVDTEPEVVDLICDVMAAKDTESDTEGVQDEEMSEAEMKSLRSRLRELVPGQVVDSLLEVRRQELQRGGHYRRLAATAYLHYLTHASQCEVGQSHLTLACLRVLHLLPGCAAELQQLHLTPSWAWHTVTPQLFARLEHSNPSVRSSVSHLLSTIGSESVQLIVFPTVVGSDICRVKNEPANALKDTEHSVRRESYAKLLQVISEQDDSCVRSVSSLISELRRVTVLWHELWLSVLQQCHADMSRRLPALQLQLQQLVGRDDLLETECVAIAAEKYNITVAPVLFVLNRVLDMTSVQPETPHENQFQQSYLGDLRDAVAGLKSPADTFSPRAAWEPLRRMLSRLQRHLHGRAAHSLNLRHISPVLYNMKDTNVHLPGIDGSSGVRVHLASIDSNVTVLPTKTKPKKLLFCGSDGIRYPYLFKGQDDLHLDERLMQLLSATNKILAKSIKHRELLYRCRVYAVVPLGRRCGLIQWVSESAPLFSIYKRWQQRQQSSGGGTVQRPSEMFSARLQSALRAAGLAANTGRRQLPAELLLDVFSQLVSETPRDILATELLSCSKSPSHWWSLCRQYSVSLAVMSMVGYIIGLGDRHLDNILFDVKTGEVVHIDYNVCFEKGRTLRVPECVPFRLTQNLVTALGVSGVEGGFSASCERVLSSLRQGCDTLLALLHTFVFDPLIDWAPSNDLGITGAMYGGEFVLAERQMRGRVELNLTKSLICVQVAEIKSDWTKNKESFVSVLSQLKTSLSHCHSCLLETASLRRRSSLLESLLLDVGEARIDPQHVLWSVLVRWRGFCERKRLEQQIVTLLDRTIDEWTQFDRKQQEAESWLFSDGVGNTSALLSSFSLPLCSHGVTDFLNSTGQQQLANQCQDLDSLFQQRFSSMLSALQSSVWCFVRVVALLSCLPSAQRLSQHRCRAYLEWLTSLRQQLSPDRLAEIVVLAENTMASSGGSESTLSTVSQYRSELRRIVKQNDRRRSQLKQQLSSFTVQQQSGSCSVQQQSGSCSVQQQSDSCSLLREHGQVRRAALVSALYSQITQLLRLEGAVFDSGEMCHQLASCADSGLFVLDDLLLSVQCLCQLFLQHQEEGAEDGESIALCKKQFERLQLMINSLQTLLSRFSSVILAEAVLLVQQQEPSVLHVISCLDNMIDRNLSQPNSVIAGLEAHVHRLSFGLTSEYTAHVQSARDLRTEFVEFIDDASSRETGMSRGEMLLVGVHMLFVAVEGDVDAVLARLDSAEMWTAIDAIQKCNSLLPPVRNEEVRDVVKLVIFIMWMTTLRDFLSKCVQNSSVFSAMLTVDGSASLSSEAELISCVRRFVCQMWRRQLLGVVSLTAVCTVCTMLSRTSLDLTAEVSRRAVGASSRVSLQELIGAAIDQLPRQQFSHWQQQIVLTATQLAQQQQQCLLRELLVQADSAHERYVTLDAAHHWLWLPPPPSAPAAAASCCLDRQLSRDLLLQRLSQAQTAAACSPSVWDLLKDFEQLYSSVNQRLKWAAGANQQLSQLLEEHTDWAGIVRKTLSDALAVRDRVSAVSSCLLLSEKARRSPGGSMILAGEIGSSPVSDHDAQMKKLLGEVDAIMSQLDHTVDCSVSEGEQTLMQLVPAETECVDEEWLLTAQQAVHEASSLCSAEIARSQTALTGLCHRSRDLTMQCCDLLADQNRLIDGVRLLIKSVAKGCSGALSASAASCLSLLASQSERFSQLLRSVVSGASCQTALQETISLTNQLSETTDNLYSSVFQLAAELSVTSSSDVSGLHTDVNSSDSALASTDDGCNQYAVAVWRRARQKLDGRDPDPTHVTTVSEQVQHTVQQAVSAASLARMYEGWTAWV